MPLRTTRGDSGGPTRGRGAPSNIEGRFEQWQRQRSDDGWPADAEPTPQLKTIVIREHAKSIIARNASPDVPFDQSINPYQGCEHGCIYCYARPAHAYLGLSPGLDFETRIFAKHDAAALLRDELAAPRYACASIAIGGNTDPYQPTERDAAHHAIADRGARRHANTPSRSSRRTPSSSATSTCSPRSPNATLFHAYVSVTSLDSRLSHTLEPRASAPHRRIETIRRLADAGIPVGVMVAPVIPFITDRFMEDILARAREAGATTAGYVMLRLPNEVAPLFRDWLDAHHPLKAAHVMSLVRQMRGGRDYDTRWGLRQRGTGNLAEIIAKRFRVATERLGLICDRPSLDTTRFQPPRRGPQLDLF